MPQQVVFAIVTFLHDLFTAVWIGGLITLAVTVFPAAKGVFGKGPELRNLMEAIQKRLSTLVYISIAGLILTGILLSNRTPAFNGLFRFGNRYSTWLAIKHLLVLAMIAVTLVRSLVFGRRRRPATPSEERMSMVLLFVNAALGVIVLLLSGFVAAFSVTPAA